MADDELPDREILSRFDVPEEWKVGLYANQISIWHTPYEFTLDFAVSEPPEVEDPNDPASPVTIRNTVVARVRMPTGLIFGVLKAINAAMTAYERSWGSIKEPEWQGPFEENG
ncbi:MAG: DUF3467 domain-containing protein [Gaiellaceae bacterium]